MEINNETIDIFKKELKKVAQIDELISETRNMMKPLQERIKQLKLEKKELEKELCPTMKKNDFKKAELADKTFEYMVKQAIVPITQKSIKERMMLFFKNGPASQISFNSKKIEEKGQELFDYIYGKHNRQYIKKEEIKIKDTKT